MNEKQLVEAMARKLSSQLHNREDLWGAYVSDAEELLAVARPAIEADMREEAREGLAAMRKTWRGDCDALRAALATAQADMREKCAAVCEGLAATVLHPTQTITDRCAAAIRALPLDGEPK